MADPIRDLIEMGKKHFEGKNYTRAQSIFLKILKSGRHYPDILNMMGVIQHRDGKFNDAISFFKEALKINPDYTEANLNLAVLLNDLGRYKESKALFTHIKKKSSAKLDPVLKGKVTNLHAALGDIYKAVGMFNEAIIEYQKALKISPTYADIRTKLGICLRDNNQKELSQRTLESTSKDSPKYLQAQIEMGINQFMAGQKTKAVTSWKNVLKKNPNNLVVQMFVQMSGKS
ncbi:MAG: tetratricopeptide repeat protein [Deltaproteobacteria bacterium]|nr:MAG: tetratricopeptide repeat protein [Deltaproteobacteria bacterium]